MHRPAHNGVSRLAPRRSAPMHNIGAVTAVMADALLKDTDRPERGSAAERKFLAPPYYSQRAAFASPLGAFFIVYCFQAPQSVK